ncbi:MAG: MBL fold metallo-hydrolase [Planctomycetes bacterium]|nr:MBL fold metallo-hydrolase [Planctomycetota bacterium]
MLIRSWGARGSIPVCGQEYLRYGGDTTCIEVRSNGGVLIIDAGSGIRRLGNALAAEGVTAAALLFTHAHWDHLLGFPFFRPLYDARCRISIFGFPCAQQTIRRMISETMSPPNFPVPLEEVHAELEFHETDDCGQALNLFGLDIVPIPLSHPDRGLGHKLIEGGRSFVFLTDNEPAFPHESAVAFDDYVEFCRGADLLFHDAEFTPAEYPHKRGWGHSSYRDALELARRAGVRSLGLFHHNQDRTDAEIDGIVEDCRRFARDGGGPPECFAVSGETSRRL